MIPDEERLSGAVIGDALGDALGFVVEGEPPEVCREYIEGVLETGSACGYGCGSYPFGHYSDVSQLAREMLQSYAARGRFDPRATRAG